MVTKEKTQLLAPSQRARQPEDKALRRAAIIQAADRLLTLEGVQLPSVSAVAAEAGFAKGTIYTYFDTKEEVYLGLLSDGFGRWISEVKRALSVAQPDPRKVLECYVGFCVSNPKTLYLASLAPTILEHNISLELARQFKQALADETRAVGRLMAQAFPGMAEPDAVHLFLSSYALTLGVWQLAHPAKVIRQVTCEPAISILRPDFEQALTRALGALWNGSFVNRQE